MTDGAGAAAVPRRRLRVRSPQLQPGTADTSWRPGAAVRLAAAPGRTTVRLMMGSVDVHGLADPKEHGPRAVYRSEVRAALSARRPS